ncbi:MAG TPA: CRISPR-associated protein Csx19 [Anaerolineales bacterium]|nr:CRISPR-associated protein Csx19 [Anaerolineales bacterium]
MSQTLPTVKNDFDAPKDGGAKKWLEDNASDSRNFLLAFAYDGVIWGKHDDQLKTSSPLNEDTLQQAFLFGDTDELRLFRGEEGEWKACLTTDTNVDREDMIEEYQLLWGTEALSEQTIPGFTQVRDRVQQAMEHALPLDLNGLNLDEEGPRLLVRHFIDYDNETGEARVFLSRLVKLGTGPVAEEKIK